MANLAEFYIDASPPSVRGFDADTSGTHELRLAVSSSMVRTVTYHVRPAVPVATSPRATLGAAVLTLDNGVTTGQAVPATTPTAIVEVSGFPAVNTTAHLWEVLCLVNGGFNDRGVPDPDYRFSRFVAIRNEALLRKIMAFERNEYDPIESWAKAVNDLIDAAFGGSGGATNSDLVVNASDVDGASVSDALETLADGTVPITAAVIAGAGMTGGGAFSSGNPTLNVIANPDGSIIVSANDVRVGVISDAQHGARGGGTQHAVATITTNGFMSAAQVVALGELVAGSVTAHSGLTGLSSDDHQQYLLVTGTRAMGGDFNVGGHAITNVGLVDGVDVSDHSARHQPGGADALTMGSPVAVGTALADGTANTFARADHVHTHGVQAGGTLHAAATTAALGFIQLAGDLGGTGASPDVLRINGASVPVAGSLTTGHVLQVSGTSALVYGLIEADNLSPTAGITATQIAAGGANNVFLGGATSNSWGTIVNANVSPTAAIANTKLAPGSAYEVLTTNSGATATDWILLVNANLSPTAEIAVSKLANGTDGQILVTSGTSVVWASRSAADYASFLMLDGTRAMTGALNMGTYAITNVGLVDGVDVSAHAARHQPGGADAIPTATTVAVGTAAAVGTSTSLSRADHVHAHGDQTVGTLHAVASATVAGFMPTAMWSTVNALPATSASAATTITAGAGLSGGGTLAANRTFAVGANADGSIVVNADDIQVGVISNANITDGTIAVDKLDPGTTNYVVATNAAGTDVTWTRLTSAHLSNSAAIAATQLARGATNTVLWSNGTVNAMSTNPVVGSVQATSNLSVGSLPSTIGALRLSFGSDVYMRSYEGDSVALVSILDSTGNVSFGSTTALRTGALYTYINAPKEVRVCPGASSTVLLSAGSSAFVHGSSHVVITDGAVTLDDSASVQTAPTDGTRLFSYGDALYSRSSAGALWQLSAAEGPYTCHLTKVIRLSGVSSGANIPLMLSELAEFIPESPDAPSSLTNCYFAVSMVQMAIARIGASNREFACRSLWILRGYREFGSAVYRLSMATSDELSIEATGSSYDYPRVSSGSGDYASPRINLTLLPGASAEYPGSYMLKFDIFGPIVQLAGDWLPG